MRTLPKAVAGTAVGKKVELKIWRNKKLITKKLTLGRLESSEEFKAKQKPIIKKQEEIDVESLKIKVRDLNEEDIKSRKLDKKTKGSLIVEISKDSPLANSLNINDIIIEVQKKPINQSINLDKIVKDTMKSGEKTLLLTVINSTNRKNYLGVKIN